MNVIAVYGDLHLSERSPRYSHALDVLDGCISLALDRGAQHHVFLGDVFEGDPTPDEYAAFLSRVLQLVKHGHVMIIRGNHESYSAYKFFELLDPRIIVAWDSFRTVEIDGANVLLIPYPTRHKRPFADLDESSISGSMREAAQRIGQEIVGWDDPPRPLLVFGHFTIEGTTTRDAEFELHHASEVVVPLEYLRPASLVRVGHIHRAQQDVTGSLYRCSFAEAEDLKVFTLVTIVDRVTVTSEEIPTPCRGMREFALELSEIGPTKLMEIEEAAAAGNEIKLVVSMDSTEMARYDASVFEKIERLAPLFVLEKDVRPVQRVRAPELRSDMGLLEELLAWARATDIELPPERVAALGQKLEGLT